MKDRERLENLLKNILKEQRAMEEHFADVMVKLFDEFTKSVDTELAREVGEALIRDLKDWDRKRKEKKGEGGTSEHIS